MKWINVKDRLPEEGQEVIVWLSLERETDLDRICKNTTVEEFKTSYSHWMPLPEPPN